MAKDKADSQSLKESLLELEKIGNWFEEQDELDVEEGIDKIKKGADLLKDARKKLKVVENEFEEIKKSLKV